jgi:hypothetical protein
VQHAVGIPVRTVEQVFGWLAPGLIPLPFDSFQIAVDAAAGDQHDGCFDFEWLAPTL